MKLLYILVKDSIYDLPFALKDMGHDVTVLEEHPFDPVALEYTEPFALVENTLAGDKYDYVLTYLFIPGISDLCEKYRIPYIAWVYDSPLISIFHESVFNSMNRIFIFDKAFFNRLIQIGIPHVYYMPLAANTTRWNDLAFTDEDRERFFCDISFVGSLYEQNAYNDNRNLMPPEVLVPMNHYLLHNMCNWHDVRPWPYMSDTGTSFFSNANTDNVTKFQMPMNLFLGILFQCRKLAEMERITSLNTLAEQHKVELYTNGSSSETGILNVHPPVNYYTELGKVYHFSRINLNFTLPSIETGVPLRVYDILACGGFLLTNYQQELDTLFTPGKDLVYFHDLGELKDLTSYYLEHENERAEIARQGYTTVNKLYNYETQLKKIFDICENIQ